MPERDQEDTRLPKLTATSGGDNPISLIVSGQLHGKGDGDDWEFFLLKTTTVSDRPPASERAGRKHEKTRVEAGRFAGRKRDVGEPKTDDGWA